jgi:ribosome maturation factor RimP
MDERKREKGQEEKQEKSASPRAAARRLPGAGGARVAETVRGLLEPVAESLGYLLWSVEYVREGADYVLRLTIDKPDVSGSITLEDCEAMSHAADPVLDEADPIGQGYMLEVSSPGLERDLTREEHFSLCAGEKAELRLFAPTAGRRSFVGILRGTDTDGCILLEMPEGIRKFPRAAVSRAHIVFDFGAQER